MAQRGSNPPVKDYSTPAPGYVEPNYSTPSGEEKDYSAPKPAKGISTEEEARAEYSRNLSAWDPRMLALGGAALVDKAKQFGSDTLSGLAQIPGMVKKGLSGDATGLMNDAGAMVKGGVKAVFDPVVDVADATLGVGDDTPESAREKLSRGTVGFATGTAPALLGVAKTGKNIIASQAPKAAERMTRYSKKGSGAVGPERVNLEGTMETTLREKGTAPIKQTGNDAHIMENLAESKANLDKVVQSVPRETTIPKAYLREAYQRAIRSLDPKNPDHQGAVSKMQWIADEIESLPDNANFHQARELKIKLDNEIASGKGFTPTVKAEADALATKKGVVGSLRDLLSEFAPDKKAWDAANDSYHSWKTRGEIVERQRPEVLAAGKKGLDAQVDAAGNRVIYGDSGVPNIASGAAKATMGMQGSAAVEGGRLLGRKLQEFDRAIAKGNEKLLDLSGREYGEFYPPEVRKPSALIEEVRKNQAGLTPEEVVGVPTSPSAPMAAAAGSGYVKMGGHEYPENYAANMDIQSPQPQLSGNQRVYSQGPGVEDINLAGTKPVMPPYDEAAVRDYDYFYDKTKSSIGGVDEGMVASAPEEVLHKSFPKSRIEGDPLAGQAAPIAAEEGLVGQAAQANRARIVPVAGNQPPVGSKLSSFDSIPEETGLIPEEVGTMAPPKPAAAAYLEEPRTGNLSGQQQTLPGAAPLSEQADLAGIRNVPDSQEPFYSGPDNPNQRQLFDLEQSAPPRWEPAMRDTFTSADLQSMLSEIEGYVKQNPSKASQWASDVEALRSELFRRKAAAGVNKGGTQ